MKSKKNVKRFRNKKEKKSQNRKRYLEQPLLQTVKSIKSSNK